MDNYVQCAVRTCSNNSRKTGNRIRYFRFPRDDDLLTLWTVRCDRLDTWTPSASFICSSHFTADDYLEVTPGISRLHPEAVPSRNLGYDWDSEDRADVMMMEEDFTSEDDDNDSIARALMSMSDRTRVLNVPASPVVNYPLTGTSPLVSTYPTTSTQSDSDQVMSHRSIDMQRPHDPNVIVITDVRKKYKPVKQVDPSTLPVLSTPKKRNKKLFCCVPTCSAWKGKDKDIRNGFHYLPKEQSGRAQWVRSIFHDNLYCKRSRFICRRHFTTDDYLEQPRSGAQARLRKGAVPTQNIPICEAEALLARKKLWLDIMRRKPQDKNLTFVEQLAREPELRELLKRYVEEASQIDPRRAEVVPFIPRRGEIKGCGEPVQGTGIKPEKNTKKKKSFEEMTGEERLEYLDKKNKKEEAKKEKAQLRELRRKLRRKQLSEERKMKLFEEKLERLELRKSNPEAYHQLLAEERLMQRKEEHAKRIASGASMQQSVIFSDKIKISAKERSELRESDPEAYHLLLAKDRVTRRKEELAKKISCAASTEHPVNFSEKIEIIAKDPEKGGKYKVVVKKVLKSNNDMKKDSVSQLANNKLESMEIVQNVIKEIDFTKVKRVKFAETEKLTKISQLRSLGIDVQGLGFSKGPKDKEAASSTSGGPAIVVEPMICGDNFHGDQPQDLADDHNSDDDHFGDDHHSNDPFEDISCNENLLEDMTDGYDHSYTSKTTQLNEDQCPKDPFEELSDRLQSMPEDEARALVKEKMDGYKETFKKQMTRMRAVLKAKKKVDRKVKMLTRALCLSLREQYVKYYKN